MESSQRLRLKDLLSVPKEDASVEQVEVTLLDAGQGWSGRITGRCNVVKHEECWEYHGESRLKQNVRNTGGNLSCTWKVHNCLGALCFSCAHHLDVKQWFWTPILLKVQGHLRNLSSHHPALTRRQVSDGWMALGGQPMVFLRATDLFNLQPEVRCVCVCGSSWHFITFERLCSPCPFNCKCLENWMDQKPKCECHRHPIYYLWISFWICFLSARCLSNDTRWPVPARRCKQRHRGFALAWSK